MTQVNQVTNNEVKVNGIVSIDSNTFKIVEHEQYFRETKGKDGKKEKRDNVKFLVPSIPFDDSGNETEDETNLAVSIAELVSSMPKQIKAILDKAMLDEAKRMFVENKDDWNFIPDAKSISLKLIGDKLLEPVKKGRTITKESLKKLSDWYKVYAVNALGKSEKAAENGGNIIADNFKSYINEPDVLNMFVSMFDSVIAESESNDETIDEVISSEDKVTLIALNNQLKDAIEVMNKAKFTPDML